MEIISQLSPTYQYKRLNFKAEYNSSDFLSEKEALIAIRTGKLDPNLVNKDGDTMFQVFVRKNYLSIVNYLTAKKNTRMQVLMGAPNRKDALDYANKNRPDLKSYIAIKNAMKESLKYTKRQWYPELSANAAYNYRRNDGSNYNSISYGADLSIPTIRPVAIKYDIDAAKAELDSAGEDVRLIYQNIYYDVQLGMCQAKILENQIPLILNRVHLAKENFELADGRYLEGIGNYIELQDARSKYLNAQQEYVDTVYKYSIARANLDFVMGVK